MSTAIIKLEFLPLDGAELTKFIPDFIVDGRLTDPVKMAADLANKKSKWLDGAVDNVLTSKIVTYGGYLYGPEGPEMDDTEYIDDFYYNNKDEEKTLESLVQFIKDECVEKLYWHNAYKYNLRLYLTSFKYKNDNLFKSINNIFVLPEEQPQDSIDTYIQSSVNHMSIEDLGKYFNIDTTTKHTEKTIKFFDEVDVISKLYERFI